MHGRQLFVAIAKMILSELTTRVALILEQVRDGWRPVWDAML
jgi:hypothetical protein